MGKFFDLDSPLMRVLSKMTDIMWLNVLTIVCSLPIVTAGAAFTALHYSCLKLVRGEESYVTKDFFKSFKQNLKQGIVITIILIFVVVLLSFDFYFLLTNQQTGKLGSVVLAGLGVVVLLVACTVSFLFPILARFNNTIKGTIKNAFMMSMLVLPKTLLMIVMAVAPAAIWYFVPQVAPLCFLFFFGAPAYLSAMLYSKTFKKYEPEDTDDKINDDFSWTVGGDESDEEISEESVDEDSQDKEKEGV